MGTFVVTAVAESRAYLARPFIVDLPKLPQPMRILLTMREKVLPGFDRPVHQGLGAHVTIEAETLDQAVSLSMGVVSLLAGLLSCLANAAVDEMMLHVAYDATPGQESHQFHQVLEQDRIFLGDWRELTEVDAAASLKVWMEHPQAGRLQRATMHYHRALIYWSDAGNVHSLNHLWIAAESLTDVLLHRECSRRGVSPAKLRKQWGKDSARGLEQEIRTRLIFQGDADLHRETVAASDGYEHGFQDLDMTGRAAQKLTRRVAHLVRQALLDLLESTPGDLRTLASAVHDTPIGLRRRDVLTATLRTAAGELAQPGQLVPFFTFFGRPHEGEPRGLTPMRLANEIHPTPQVADGVTVSDLRIERLS